MKIAMVLALALALSGCATSKHQIAQPGIADGVWTGTLKSDLISADESMQSGSSNLIIAACNGVVRVWASEAGGLYRKLGEKYAVISHPDSYLIYFLDAEPKQPDWVEIQTYALLEIDSDEAVLQWSRAVNNRDLPSTKNNRYFFSHGITKIHRASKSCDSRLVP